MPLTIGLTGGIGSGKSSAAKIFSELGVPVFDTDIIARQLVSPGNPTVIEIKKIFGDDIILKTGEIDRQKLKQTVFNDSKLRQQLESILHPEIRRQLLNLITTCTAPYCIAVIPLLIEKNWVDIVDRVLVIDLPEAIQLDRVKTRDNATDSLIQQIINTQVDRNKRLSKASDVIDNRGNLQTLTDQVNKLHEKYLNLSKTGNLNS